MPMDVARIKKKVGKRATFRHPGSEGTRRGILKDRKIAWRGKNPTGADYCDVVDIIKFDGQKEPWLRIGYYRQAVGGPIRWAGQTTICEPLSRWREKILPIVAKLMDEASKAT
jgi:hypothetical protein